MAIESPAISAQRQTCKACRFHVGILFMRALPKLFSAAMLAVSAPMVGATNLDMRGARADMGASTQVIASVSEAYGKTSGATATHVARVNRALWEKSFEHGSNTSVVALAASFPSAPVAGTTWSHLKVGYGLGGYGFGRWPIISNSFYGIDIQNGLYRKPGIGACLLAALAIAGLAVLRRRTGHHPIVPPRPLLDVRASANGAQ